MISTIIFGCIAVFIGLLISYMGYRKFTNDENMSFFDFFNNAEKRAEKEAENEFDKDFNKLLKHLYFINGSYECLVNHLKALFARVEIGHMDSFIDELDLKINEFLNLEKELIRRLNPNELVHLIKYVSLYNYAEDEQIGRYIFMDVLLYLSVVDQHTIDNVISLSNIWHRERSDSDQFYGDYKLIIGKDGSFNCHDAAMIFYLSNLHELDALEDDRIDVTDPVKYYVEHTHLKPYIGLMCLCIQDADQTPLNDDYGTFRHKETEDTYRGHYKGSCNPWTKTPEKAAKQDFRSVCIHKHRVLLPRNNRVFNRLSEENFNDFCEEYAKGLESNTPSLTN